MIERFKRILCRRKIEKFITKIFDFFFVTNWNDDILTETIWNIMKREEFKKKIFTTDSAIRFISSHLIFIVVTRKKRKMSRWRLSMHAKILKKNYSQKMWNLLQKITTCKKFVSIKMRLKSVQSREERTTNDDEKWSSNKKNSHIHKSRGLLTRVRNENGFMTCSLFC